MASKSAGSIFVKLSLGTAGFTGGLKEAEKGLTGFGQRFQKEGAKVAASLGAPLAAIGAVALRESVRFESAFTGVLKTVEGTDKQLENLRKGILQMSTEIPAGAVAISAVAEAAGQLGIQTDNILGFSRVMIGLGETTNLSADEASTALARLANITNLPQDQFDRLGSSIVDLGNNFATTEAEIVEFGLRLAGAGNVIGLSQAEILAFGATLSSVGINAEAGGTALSTLFLDIQKSVELGGSALQNFADVAGMSSAEFKIAFGEDAAQAIVEFVEGLSSIKEEGGSVIQTLETLGITEKRQRMSLLNLAGAGDLLRRSIDKSNTAFKENNALQKEVALRYGTTESRLKTLQNKITKVAIDIGDVLKNDLLAIADGAESVIGDIDDLSDATKRFIANLIELGTLTGGVGLLTLALGKLVDPKKIAAWGALTAATSAWFAVVQTNAPQARKELDDFTTSIGRLFEGVADKLSRKATAWKNFFSEIGAAAVDALDVGSDFTPYLFPEPKNPYGHGMTFGNIGKGTLQTIYDAFADIPDFVTPALKKAATVTYADPAKEAAAEVAAAFEQVNEVLKSNIAFAEQAGGAFDDLFVKTKAGASGGGAQPPPTDKDIQRIEKAKSAIAGLKREYMQLAADTEKQQLFEDLSEFKFPAAKDFNKVKQQQLEAIRDGFLQGNAEAIKAGGPAAEAWAKKTIDARQKAETSYFDNELTRAAERWWDEEIERAEDAHTREVDAWRGMLEDAITGTRFSFEDQFKKAGVTVASNFLAEMSGGGTGLEDLFAGAGSALADVTKDIFSGNAPNLDVFGQLLEDADDGLLISSIFANASSALKKLGKDTENTVAAGIETGFTVAGGVIGGAVSQGKGIGVGAMIGQQIGQLVGLPIAEMLFSDGDAQAKDRKSVEGYLEDLLGGTNVVFGGRDRFESDWSETFSNLTGEGQGAFEALGIAVTQFAGASQEQANQIGFILAENLSGNLDRARLLVKELGYSTEEMTEAFLQAGLKGHQSWAQVTAALGELNMLTGEGLVAVGDVEGAYKQLIATGGKGFVAIDSLKTLAIEAGEAGATTLQQLAEKLIATGVITQEEVERLLSAFDQHGIKTMDELEAASVQTLGSIIANLEHAGIEWEKYGESIQSAVEYASDLEKRLDNIDGRNLDIDVNFKYNNVNKPPDGVDITTSFAKGGAIFGGRVQMLAKGGVLNSPAMFSHRDGLAIAGEAGDEFFMKAMRNNRGELGFTAQGGGGGTTVVYNVDARGATPGTAQMVRAAVEIAHRHAISSTLKTVSESRRRGAF